MYLYTWSCLRPRDPEGRPVFSSNEVDGLSTEDYRVSISDEIFNWSRFHSTECVPKQNSEKGPVRRRLLTTCLPIGPWEWRTPLRLPGKIKVPEGYLYRLRRQRTEESSWRDRRVRTKRFVIWHNRIPCTKLF